MAAGAGIGVAADGGRRDHGGQDKAPQRSARWTGAERDIGSPQPRFSTPDLDRPVGPICGVACAADNLRP